MRLNEGSGGIRYKIVGVREGEPCTNCTPCLRLRLLEFGFLIGEEVEIKREGDPMIIRIGDNWDMGLRGNEAVRIEIQPKE
jgi:Fe2+ transport system protein FeoA